MLKIIENAFEAVGKHLSIYGILYFVIPFVVIFGYQLIHDLSR